MRSLEIVSIVLGTLIIVIRGPLVLAPKATLLFYRQMIETNARIRVLGVIVALLGLAMIASAWGATQTAAQIILVFGWFFSLVSLFLLLLFPSLYRRLAGLFLDVFEDGPAARAVGVVAVGIGAFFLYLGISVF